MMDESFCGTDGMSLMPAGPPGNSIGTFRGLKATVTSRNQLGGTMVAIGISEFTFGYSFLYEQTHMHWDDLIAAPILPSLQQEQHGGWDAHLPLLGDAFFFQFKLSEYLYRGNAKYIQKGIYSGPYFRLSLHQRDCNKQHRLLRAHWQNNPNTFYVAPELRTIEQFNDAFLDRSLTQHSRLFSLGDCDDIDDSDSSQHYITFRHDIEEWNFHSDGKSKDRSFFGENIRQLYLERGAERKVLSLDFARELLIRTTEAVPAADRGWVTGESHLNLRPVADDRNAVLQRVADIAATVFGVTLVIVGPRS